MFQSHWDPIQINNLGHIFSLTCLYQSLNKFCLAQYSNVVSFSNTFAWYIVVVQL
jgi:hypothetical protein